MPQPPTRTDLRAAREHAYDPVRLHFKKRWVWLTIVVFVGAGAAILIRHDTQDATFSLDRQVVKPGQSFSVVTTFINIWPLPVAAVQGRVAILNDQGIDRHLDVGGIVQMLGVPMDHVIGAASWERDAAAPKLHGALEMASGFIYEDIYSFLKKFPRANDPYDRLVSECPAGGRRGGKPPRRTQESETFVVLSGTPPGTYVVKVPPHRYCDAYRNSGAVMLLKVQAAG
jgi:hypothetical protein